MEWVQRSLKQLNLPCVYVMYFALFLHMHRAALTLQRALDAKDQQVGSRLSLSLYCRRNHLSCEPFMKHARNNVTRDSRDQRAVSTQSVTEVKGVRTRASLSMAFRYTVSSYLLHCSCQVKALAAELAMAKKSAASAATLQVG